MERGSSCCLNSSPILALAPTYLFAQGETNRGAAARLFISEATVKTHLLHIYKKLSVGDRAAAVAAAYERGLLASRQR